ncbi:MAG: thermonuclease family protein [Sphingobium sp.]
MARHTPSSVHEAWRREAARAGAARLRRPPAPQHRWRLSGPAVVYALCLGLLLGWYAPAIRDRLQASHPAATWPATAGQSPDTLSASFGLCHSGGGGGDCVVDGDTFWFAGSKYRIADIDTPETHPPRCAAEAALGAQATLRLQALMNAGAFTLEIGERDSDRYGRALRIVTRDGRSIGDQLVADGLARRWDGARHPWC